jgi:hypothetical protein
MDETKEAVRGWPCDAKLTLPTRRGNGHGPGLAGPSYVAWKRVLGIGGTCEFTSAVRVARSSWCVSLAAQCPR